MKLLVNDFSLDDLWRKRKNISSVFSIDSLNLVKFLVCLNYRDSFMKMAKETQGINLVLPKKTKNKHHTNDHNN